MSAWGGFKKIIRTAITQIVYTFRKSVCSIVINGGLCNMDTSGKHVQVAMRILTSGWMRRLWTLQEVLSKSLKVVFKQEKAALGGIVDFDETIMSMTDSTQLLRQKMMHSMMGNERETMIRLSSLAKLRGSDLITNAWCALPYHGACIKRAGAEFIASATKKKLMVDFWRLIHSHYKGSIARGDLSSWFKVEHPWISLGAQDMDVQF
ncbi:hypothetical protein PG990_013602 [Apiospora arundinis]